MPAPDDIRAVLKTYEKPYFGVVRMTVHLQASHNISYRRVYCIMREAGLVKASAAKSRRCKWVRYERRYSNAMWHVDWHEMKDPRFRGLQLVT